MKGVTRPVKPAAAGAGTGAEASSAVASNAPLSCAAWFARQARRHDILLLMLDLVILNWAYLVKVMFRRGCLPVAGSPHAAIQDAVPPATHPAAARADARLASFPCGAPYLQQLLHVAASGALTDPWVRLRAGDYANLVVIVTQLLAILVAVLLPRVYVRVRHWLLFAVNAAVPIGVIASVAWAPAALLLVGVPAYLGHYWGSIMMLYLAWKTVYVLRIPSSQQLFSGPLVWIMTVAAVAAARVALYPPSATLLSQLAITRVIRTGAAPSPPSVQADNPQHHGRFLDLLLQQLLQGPALCAAVMSFVVIVVLPYMMVRTWERAVLRHRYGLYLAAAARGEAAGHNSSGGRTGVAGISIGGGSADTCKVPQEPQQPRSSCGAAGRSENVAVRVADRGNTPAPPPPTPATAAQADKNALADRNVGGGGQQGTDSSPGDSGACPDQVTRSREDPQPEPRSATFGPCSNPHPPIAHPQWHPSPHTQQHYVDPPRQASPEARALPAPTGRTGAGTAAIFQTRTPPPSQPTLDLRLLLSNSYPRPQSAATVTHATGTSSMRSGNSIHSNSSSATSSTIGRRSPGTPLYGNLSPYRAQLLSLKLPLRHAATGDGGLRGGHAGSGFQARSPLVLAAAEGALMRRNAASSTAADAAAEQPPDVAASSLAGTLPRVALLASVCVEGCVHLLMLVYAPWRCWGGERVQWQQGNVEGGGAAGLIRHQGFDLPLGDVEEEPSEAEIIVAAERALDDMLARLGGAEACGGSGGGGGGGGGLAGGDASEGVPAAVWPPAFPLVEGGVAARGAAGELAGSEEEGGRGDMATVVAVCGVSLLRGLEAVRVVVAGQGDEGGVGEAGGVEEDQHAFQAMGRPGGCVHLDCVVPVEYAGGRKGEEQQPGRGLPREKKGQEQEFAHPEAGEHEEQGVARVRLQLPRSALLQAGALTLCLLPPPSAEAAAHPATPAPPGPHQPPGPHPHAPLCFLPLLVLPAAAAREVAQLHAYAVAREMGWGKEEARHGKGGQQQQPGVWAGAVRPAGSDHTAVVGNLLLDGSGSASDAVATMSALHRNGTYNVSYDFAALLNLPYTTLRGSAPDPWVFCGVLRLLAEQGMGACLRMGLGAMQRAGVRLDWDTVPEGARRGGGDYGTPEGGAAVTKGAGLDVDTAVQFLMDTASGRTQGSFGSSSCRSSEQGVAIAGGPVGHHGHVSSGRASASGAHAAGLVPGAAVRGSVTTVPSFGAPPTPQQPLVSVRTPHSQPTSSGPPTSSTNASAHQLPQPPGSCRWWLCALVYGFSPTALEAEYQSSYKAAWCRAYDFTALAVHVAMATITLVRMIQEGHGAGGLRGGDELPGAAAGAREARGGGYDRQLAGQALWVGVNLSAFLLVALTGLHARNRNLAMLLRAAASATALMVIMWNAPTPHPAVNAAAAGTTPDHTWIAMPEAWVDSCQHYSFHWLLYSLYEPLMMRLSPPCQALAAAMQLLPTALMGLRVNQYQRPMPPGRQAVDGRMLRLPGQHGGGRGGDIMAKYGRPGTGAASTAAWRAAAVFAVGNAVCGLVISAVTDLAGRVAFVKELRRRAAAGAQQQLSQHEKCGGGGVTSSSSRTIGTDGKRVDVREHVGGALPM